MIAALGPLALLFDAARMRLAHGPRRGRHRPPRRVRVRLHHA